MSEPDTQIQSESLSQTISPISILKQAVSKVPALKYALGVAGIAAAIAIIKSLLTDMRLAVFGIIVMLVLMTVLFIFAKLTSIASKEIKLPAIVLLWFSLLLTIASGSLLFTSVFFDWPINLKHLLGGPSSPSVQPSANDKTTSETTYLRGVVRNLNTKERIAGAIIEAELLPGKTFTSLSDGGFSIEEIPAKPGDRARFYVRKEGYKTRDEYATLPGPETFYLERNR